MFIPGLSPSRSEIGYEVPDNWSPPFLIKNLDSLFIYNYLNPGYDALIQFGDEQGHEFEVWERRVQSGVNTWDERGKYGHGSFRLKARTAGDNPIIDFECDGLPGMGVR